MACHDFIDLATEAEVPVVTKAHELVTGLEHHGDFLLALTVGFLFDDSHRRPLLASYMPEWDVRSFKMPTQPFDGGL
jgi:hypothetical protein